MPQLRAAGIGEAATRRLVARAYLVRLYPGVYAVGHEPLRIEGRLLAALFHAGPGSALSHTTAAWWWRILESAPSTIHIATSHRPVEAAGLKLHRPRQIEAVTERHLSVTGVNRTLIDCASMLEFKALRTAVAQADHRGLLDSPSLLAQIRPGQPGGRALRKGWRNTCPSWPQPRVNWSGGSSC